MDIQLYKPHKLYIKKSDCFINVIPVDGHDFDTLGIDEGWVVYQDVVTHLPAGFCGTAYFIQNAKPLTEKEIEEIKESE